MNKEQINELTRILSTLGLTHHLVVTWDDVATEYIINHIDFERPPQISMQRMYSSWIEPDFIEILGYENIHEFQIVGHNNNILFEWMPNQ